MCEEKMQVRNREERLQIMLSPQELSAIDDFRFEYRLPSRAAAVRELLKRGLAAPSTGIVGPDSHSKDFGVLDIANGSSFENTSEGSSSDA